MLQIRKPGLAMGALLVCVLALESGCVAMNVGRPEVFTHTDEILETSEQPVRTGVDGVQVRLEQRGDRASVRLVADLRDEFRKTRRTETAVVKKQKRLAVGLFPGAAENFLMPDGALVSGVLMSTAGSTASNPVPHVLYDGPDLMTGGGAYVGAGVFSVVCVPLTVITWPFGTLQNLLFEPFASWECKHDFLDTANMKTGLYNEGTGRYIDVSRSPKLQQLMKFPEAERKRMGIRTCFDLDGARYHSIIDIMTGNLGHFGIVGIHKYLAVFIDPPARGEPEDAGTEVRTRQSEVQGPYVVEMAIPATGYRHAVRVGAGGTGAVFALPHAARDGVATARVAIRRDAADGAVSVETAEALAKTLGKIYSFDVELKAAAPSSSPGAREVAPPPPSPSRETPAPTMTVEPAAGPARSMYEIVGIRRNAEGRYEVRVKVADRARTFDIGTALEPDVKKMIREDYANRHPGTGIQYVREIVEWETEEEGRVLVYRGWAFSFHPVKWSYDPATRRGQVRLRISAGMSAEETKRWARENISAIVADKNVAVGAGEAPPPGAVYLSLGEALENGVLTVEFEAVR